jgi:hypothetical protein
MPNLKLKKMWILKRHFGHFIDHGFANGPYFNDVMCDDYSHPSCRNVIVVIVLQMALPCSLLFVLVLHI